MKNTKIENRVVEFKADEYDARRVPFLREGETLRGIVTDFTSGDDSKAVIVCIVGNRFYKFYKGEDDLTMVER